MKLCFNPQSPKAIILIFKHFLKCIFTRYFHNNTTKWYPSVLCYNVEHNHSLILFQAYRYSRAIWKKIIRPKSWKTEFQFVIFFSYFLWKHAFTQVDELFWSLKWVYQRLLFTKAVEYLTKIVYKCIIFSNLVFE